MSATPRPSLARAEIARPLEVPPRPHDFCVGEGAPLHVFAYGSLIWNPGFEFTHRETATARGRRRDLCLISMHYRGTRVAPGIVWGLDAGGSCRGLLYRVAPEVADATLDYLWQREMIGGFYKPVRLRCETPSGVREAFSFAVRREAGNYAGALDDDERIRLVLQGVGAGGSAREYFARSEQAFAQFGIRCRRIQELGVRLARAEGAVGVGGGAEAGGDKRLHSASIRSSSSDKS